MSKKIKTPVLDKTITISIKLDKKIDLNISTDAR